MEKGLICGAFNDIIIYDYPLFGKRPGGDPGQNASSVHTGRKTGGLSRVYIDVPLSRGQIEEIGGNTHETQDIGMLSRAEPCTDAPASPGDGC